MQKQKERQVEDSIRVVGVLEEYNSRRGGIIVMNIISMYIVFYPMMTMTMTMTMTMRISSPSSSSGWADFLFFLFVFFFLSGEKAGQKARRR